MEPVLPMLLEFVISIAIIIMTWHWMKTADFWVNCFKVFLPLQAPLNSCCFTRPHQGFQSWFETCGKMLHSGNFYGLKQPPSSQKQRKVTKILKISRLAISGHIKASCLYTFFSPIFAASLGWFLLTMLNVWMVLLPEFGIR